MGISWEKPWGNIMGKMDFIIFYNDEHPLKMNEFGEWLVYFMEHPNIPWMITRGSPKKWETYTTY